jgi:hypothetical protein
VRRYPSRVLETRSSRRHARPSWPIPLGLLLAVGPVVAIGCSEDAETTVPPTVDSGSDVQTTPVDAGSTVDARPARDCVADRSADGLATHLECAGLYEDFASKRVGAATRPFTPGFSFWSDGAEKQRFVYLPPGSKIDVSNFDEWSFPKGTRFWKEFTVGGKRIETRLFEKLAEGWKRTSYRWNDGETDATRTEAGELLSLPGRTPYEVPKGEHCDYCHAGRVEPVLGFQALSLGVATASGVTLSVLQAEGWLSTTPPATTLMIPNDDTTLAAPAIGWLHANCGHCHNSNPNAGAAGASLRMLVRPSQLLPDSGVTSARGLDVWSTGVCKPSERDAPSGGKYLYIAGGSASTSLAAILLGSRADAGTETIISQMPPIVTHAVDVAGKKLVDDWIAALPTCP